MAAASASSVQSIFATGRVTRVGNQTRRNQISSSSLPRQQRNVNRSMNIRCMAEEPKKSPSSSSSSPSNLPKSVTNSSSSITPPSPVTATAAQTTPPPPPPPRAPKMSTKINDLLAFSGPAPERINGRLAMIGFVAAIGAELAKGDDVVAQLANGGLPWFIGTSVILTLASLIPLSKGVSVESKSSGVMSSSAEMWNGRFAMLGLVALVFTEFVTGGALV